MNASSPASKRRASSTIALSKGRRIYFVSIVSRLACVLAALLLILGLSSPAAQAGVNDDRYEGNIYPLFAGNGYLVPPRINLADSLKSENPTVLVLYVDDSFDCKQFAPTVSQLDAFYGRAGDIIPISIDSIPPKDTYEPTEAGYYFKGMVPQVVIFDQSGKIRLDEAGQVPFEKMDDVMREIFDLLPRSQSVELKRRVVNEINVELTP